MNLVFFFILFSLLSLFYAAVGLFVSKRVKNTGDFFLAGRNLGVLPVTFTLIATQLGGSMLLGTSEKAYTMGIYGITYTLGIILGFVILASGMARKMRLAGVATTAELFEKRYNSPALRKFASALSIMTLSGILVAQIVASRSLLLGLEFNSPLIFFAFWLLVIMYTTAGGLESVVITDMLQVAFIIIVYGSIFVYCVWNDSSSLSLLSHSLTMPAESSVATNTISRILLMPALFSLIEQDIAQRFFAAKNQMVAARSALLAGMFMFIFALIPVYFALQARALNVPIAQGGSPLLPVIEFLTNDIVVALALCGIAAAILSTADSLLCAISSNLAQDFKFKTTSLSKLRLCQLLTFLVGLITVGLSFLVSQEIIDIVIGSYELSVYCLLVPLVISYYQTNLNKNAAIGSIAMGLIGFVIIKTTTILPFGNELIPLGLSGLGYLTGCTIQKQI